MRRKDREVTDREEIRRIIGDCKVMRLGLRAEPAPYIVPMNFGWEEAQGRFVFYLHCARGGRKLELLRQCDRVGFEMDGAHELVEGAPPCAYSFRYESVIGTGTARRIDADAEKARALALILLHQTGREFVLTPAQAAPVEVICLRADELSCKRRG